MRLDHQSSTSHQDSVIVTQHSFFACGLSRKISRSAGLQSPLASGAAEAWRSGSEPTTPTRLAGGVQGQSLMAESVSATQGTCPACSGSTTARHGLR